MLRRIPGRKRAMAALLPPAMHPPSIVDIPTYHSPQILNLTTLTGGDEDTAIVGHIQPPKHKQQRMTKSILQQKIIERKPSNHAGLCDCCCCRHCRHRHQNQPPPLSLGMHPITRLVVASKKRLSWSSLPSFLSSLPLWSRRCCCHCLNHSPSPSLPGIHPFTRLVVASKIEVIILVLAIITIVAIVVVAVVVRLLPSH